MSTIKLKGSSSGEAEVTVAAAAGTPTFTLPTTVGSANQLLKNSGTAGTLEYSSNLTFDGSTLKTTASTDAALKITAGNATSQSRLLFEDSAAVDGVITYDHNDRLLHIGAGTSTATDGDLIIDSSGRVGIGSTNPVASTALFGGTQNCLKVGGSAAPQVRISSDTSNQGDLLLQAGNSGSDVYIANAASNGDLVFSTHNGTSQGERLRIYDDGAVTKPANPSCSAYWSGSSAVGGSGSRISGNNVAIANQERWDIGGHYNTSNGRYTAPVAGKYQVTFRSNLALSNLSVGHYFSINVFKNGSLLYYNYDLATQANWQYMSFTNIVNMAANDYVDLRFSSNSNNTFGVDPDANYSEVTFSLIQ